MALTATGRTAAAQRKVDAMRAFADGQGTDPRIVRECALPSAEAPPLEQKAPAHFAACFESARLVGHNAEAHPAQPAA
jgi:hypothetical protein